FAGRGRCRRRRLGLALGTAVALLLACAQVAFAEPETTIDSGPSGPIASTSATITFSSDDPSATFACTLDGGIAEDCTSSKTDDSLEQGSHTFTVGAIDRFGAPDTTPASRTFSVDTVGPD